MNSLQQVFQYGAAPVRTVLMDDEPWFVAKDVCEVFGDTNYRRSVSRLDDDEKGVSQIDTPGGPQGMTVVNESGLYSLLFFMQPQKGNLPDNRLQQKAEALRQFRRWVTHEVLPAIRKTGTYSRPTSVEDLIIMQAQSVKELRARVDQVQAQVAVVNHRIDNIDSVDVIGDLRQRLNAMVKKYAHEQGASYRQAWGEFVKAFNVAYRTNLELMRTNYVAKSMRQVTTPEFLELTNRLEDAVRVADKLLNSAC